jgi:hypothetical protein
MSGRRRTRLLHLGTRTFTWHAATWCGSGRDVCAVRLRVWGGKTGQLLQADLVSTAWLAPPQDCVLDGGYPTPGLVRTVVEYALARGWDPATRGGSFVLTEQDRADGLVLRGCAVTDLLRASGQSGPTGCLGQTPGL